MTDFDFDAPDVPATAISDVAAEISSHGKLPPLTDEQREQRRIEREIYLWECRERDEQRRLEHQRKQAEATALAEREAAIAAAQAREKARQEFRERSDREARERQRECEIADLRLKARQAESWQRNVERAARNVVVQRQQQAVIDTLDRIVDPPSPPEPDTVFVEAGEGSDQLGTSDFNPALYARPKSWW